MSCSRWHRLIALEVGGDLDPRRSRGLDKHLEGCATCRDLSEELRSQREQLVRLDREAVEGVTLGSVRHAVLADLADRRRSIFQLPAGGRRLAFAGVAAVILVVAAVVLRQGATTTQPIVAERSMPTPVPAPTVAPIPSANTDVIVEPPQAMPPPAPVEPVEHGPLRLAHIGHFDQRVDVGRQDVTVGVGRRMAGIVLPLKGGRILVDFMDTHRIETGVTIEHILECCRFAAVGQFARRGRQ